MLSDIVNNTVIEIPRFQASINIHDAFVTHILRLDYFPNNSYGSRVDLDENIIRGNTIHVASGSMKDLLMLKIGQQVEDLEQRTTALSTACGQITSYQKDPLAARWGLDQPQDWKLSKEFASMHPEMDCASSEYFTRTLPTFPA